MKKFTCDLYWLDALRGLEVLVSFECRWIRLRGWINLSYEAGRSTPQVSFFTPPGICLNPLFQSLLSGPTVFGF